MSRTTLAAPRVAEATRAAAPMISVVVASNRDRSLLQACLESLIPQCQRTGAELITARVAPRGELAELRREYPQVRFLQAPDDAGIPQLRGLGMAEAVGDIVALTEDHCVADPRWVETLARSAAGDADVVGGGMDNAQRQRAVDWGAYFAEYGFFAATRPDDGRRAPLLTGANVAYKRRVVKDVVEMAQRGEWENVAHDWLLARGSVLRFVRTAAVYQNKRYDFRPFCVDRYQHGRDYARKRLREEPAANRWVLLAGTPLLPFILTWRVGRAGDRGQLATFVRALPATFCFLAAWSFGEAVGYVRGPAPAEVR